MCEVKGYLQCSTCSSVSYISLNTVYWIVLRETADREDVHFDSFFIVYACYRCYLTDILAVYRFVMIFE